MSDFEIGEFVEINAPELKTHGSWGIVEHIAPDNRIQVLLKSGTNAGKYHFYRLDRLVNISRMRNEEELDSNFEDLVEHDQENRIYDYFFEDDEVPKQHDYVVALVAIIAFVGLLMILIAAISSWSVDTSDAQGQQISENATMIIPLDNQQDEVVSFNRLEGVVTEDFIWQEAKLYRNGELIYHVQP